MSSSRSFHNRRFHLGVAAVTGTRDYMQDRFGVRLGYGKKGDIDFFGVFDGHGPNGGKIAEYIADQLPAMIIERARSYDREEVVRAIKRSYVDLDKMMRSKPFVIKQEGMTGGSTAASAWIKDGILYAAGLGDSRILLCADGKKTNLTSLHVPTNKAEFSRISEAGGSVQFARVGSVLAVSRAFGDYEFKSKRLSADLQMVSPVPDVKVVKLPKQFDFLILATDGLFDYLTDRYVVKYVKRKRAQGLPLETICIKMLSDLQETKSCFGQCPRDLDNITAIIAVPHTNGKCRDCTTKNGNMLRGT